MNLNVQKQNTVNQTETISGVVERITFVNPENGFTVAKIKSRGYSDLVTLVGNMPEVNVGAIVVAKGIWKADAKFGLQFRVENFEEKLPATITGIEKYLGSGLIKGIGPVNAKRIVKMFKTDTLRIIEEDTEQLLKVEGIGRKRLEMIKKAWEEQKEVKNVMLFLQSHGVSTTFGVKIYKHYGNASIDVVKNNPYKLADDIWGIGFKTADKIARNMGFDLKSHARVRSGIIYVMNQLSNEGHCFASQDQLVEEAGKILEVEDDIILSTLDSMLRENSLIADKDAFFLPAFYHSEAGVARRFKEILSASSPIEPGDIEKIIYEIEKKNRIFYDPKQRDAIRIAGTSKMMVLTGGPGTGKTYTTLGIISLYRALGARILLAAPTGRAAKRISEVTHMQAKTIHRLLEYKPSEGYSRNENNQLACDVLILDEVSMVDLVLMYNLLKAVPDKAKVIFVGDVDQLPSVGAGNVLRDIIDSERVPVVKLTNIFRQARGSMIITNAHLINQGKFPYIKGPKNRDFFFMKEEDPERIAQTIVSLVTRRLPASYNIDPVRDIQVLCPMIRGTVGTHNINRLLQENLGRKGASVKYGGYTFRCGDKVMQIKNNYDKNVFNGDIGFIKNIDHEDHLLIVTFDDIDIEYDFSELDELILAYASTVHKSQGSEYPIVIAPFTTQHFMMLQRNLLYTCVTRAKKMFILIGTSKAVAMAVNNNKIVRRNTMLAERIKTVIPEPEAM